MRIVALARPASEGFRKNFITSCTASCRIEGFSLTLRSRGLSLIGAGGRAMVATPRGRVGLRRLPRLDSPARLSSDAFRVLVAAPAQSRARGPPTAGTRRKASLHDAGLATPASPGHRHRSTRAEDRNRVMAFTNSTTTYPKRNSSPEFISSTCVPRALRSVRNGA
jgi:hypothetical protein